MDWYWIYDHVIYILHWAIVLIIVFLVLFLIFYILVGLYRLALLIHDKIIEYIWFRNDKNDWLLDNYPDIISDRAEYIYRDTCKQLKSHTRSYNE